MPTAPPRICTDCTKAATVGRHCDDHQVQNQEVQNRRQSDKHRRENDPFRPLYSAARWTALRLRILFRDPLCKICGCHASTVVDHIVKAKVWVAQHHGDMESFYDAANLQGLCVRCHDLKTRRGE